MYRVDYGNSFQVSPSFETYAEAEREVELQKRYGCGRARIQKYVGNGDWAWMRDGRVTAVVL